MSIWSALRGLMAAAPAAVPEKEQPKAKVDRPKMAMDSEQLAFLMEAMGRQSGAPASDVNPFAPAKRAAPPGIGHNSGMAFDEGPEGFGNIAQWAMSGLSGLPGREGFIGYPELAIMALRPEYRSPVEIIATEATRNWIDFQSAGEKDKTDKISKIEAEFKRLEVQDRLRQVSELDGFYGRGHLYIDINNAYNDPAELSKPIGTGKDALSTTKIGKGSLTGLRTLEPLWVWPIKYNSLNPLDPEWYRPQTWWAMQNEVHSTRLLTFIAREVPDLLKPAFMFGGLSMTQMMRPVVENWLITRKSVGELIRTYSQMVIKISVTDAINSGNFEKVMRRVLFYNQSRNNQGAIILDKENEDFDNVSAPLGGLDQLQAQSQEHMASLSRIPVVKLLGIQPAGLNASSEGEISTFEDSIRAYQESFFRPNLTTILNVVQCSLFGDVDPDITFSFKPLTTLDEKEAADLRLIDAQTAEVHLRNRSISRVEERQRIAADPTTPYASLDAETEPPPPVEEAGKAAKEFMLGIAELFNDGVIDQATALRNLQNMGDVFGVGLDIDDAAITEAENEPPAPSPEDIKAQAMMIKAQSGGGANNGFNGS